MPRSATLANKAADFVATSRGPEAAPSDATATPIRVLNERALQAPPSAVAYEVLLDTQPFDSVRSVSHNTSIFRRVYIPARGNEEAEGEKEE